MATPAVPAAIVKLSNEKIRKYHLARALREIRPRSRPAPLRRPLSFSLLSHCSHSVLFLPLSPSPVRFLNDGWNNHEAFGRLPAVTGDGTTGRLAKRFRKGAIGRGWRGGKNGQSFVQPLPPPCRSPGVGAAREFSDKRGHSARKLCCGIGEEVSTSSLSIHPTTGFSLPRKGSYHFS